MKHFLRLFFILSVVLLLVLPSSCKEMKIFDEKTSDTDEFFEMDGMLTQLTQSTVTVKIPNGDFYTFSTKGIDVSCEDGMYAGCPVIVGFYGALNDFAEVQNVDVSLIAVGNSPSVAYAKNTLTQMTLEQKVGQMFFARCPAENAAQDAAQYKLGGYILFASDFKDKTEKQVQDDIKSYKSSDKIDMFIGVDEEGGTVVRVSKNPKLRTTPFLSSATLYKMGGFKTVKSDTAEKSQLLLSLGINVNFAPVCDVPTSKDDFIYDRAFSTDPQLTAQYSATVTNVMNKNGIAGCLKHFPGYGNNADTHTGIAHDKRSMESFEASDFLPFISGIKSGTRFVMVSHNIVECMDGSRPASLSPEVHNILRKKLGYDGVIITDDISMNGVTHFTENEQAAVMAVLAGNDMLCCTDYKTQVPAVIKAVQNGEIDEELINSAVFRILRLKYEMGLAK